MQTKYSDDGDCVGILLKNEKGVNCTNLDVSFPVLDSLLMSLMEKDTVDGQKLFSKLPNLDINLFVLYHDRLVVIPKELLNQTEVEYHDFEFRCIEATKPSYPQLRSMTGKINILCPDDSSTEFNNFLTQIKDLAHQNDFYTKQISFAFQYFRKIHPFNSKKFNGHYTDHDLRPNFLLTVSGESNQQLVQDEDPIAFIFGILAPVKPTLLMNQKAPSPNVFFFIQYALVDEKYRDMNIGSTMITEVLQIVSAMWPDKSVDFVVESSNEAVKFWQYLGFSKTNYDVRGNPYDNSVTWMQKTMVPLPTMNPLAVVEFLDSQTAAIPRFWIFD